MYTRRDGTKLLFCGLLACASPLFAATPIDLHNQPAAFIQSLTDSNQIKQLSSETDFNQTQHTRLQQTYEGFPVWGADFVTHTERSNNNTSMNGIIYQNLDADLKSTPAYALSDAQQDKAIQQAILLHQKKSSVSAKISEEKATKMIYVDKDNKAHWVYLISFLAATPKAIPSKPSYIMDANTFTVYQQWDDIKTMTTSDSFGGGFGGNEKMGKLSYDGIKDNLPKLSILRDDTKNTCYLQNTDVTVKDARNNSAVMEYACEKSDPDHDNVYWNADQDAVNGGFSPSNDALFVGGVVKDMYQKWYGIPVLTQNGKPMMLNMRVHEYMDNAYWDGYQMTFGDGISMFYPLVSLGVGAHEVSHGFTEQHSGLAYYAQSGGLNEAFSDMAAQAAEYYAMNKNNWEIGEEIFKQKDRALRYMDEPTKDCNGRKPGNNCSISKLSQYTNTLDVHYSSGIFNKVFYLLGTSKEWNTKKAFDVMVQANRYYWTSTTDFNHAACGVMTAAKDYSYDVLTVKKAMKQVGIDVKKC